MFRKLILLFVFLSCAASLFAQDSSLRVRVGTNVTAKNQEEWRPSFGPLMGVELEHRFSQGFGVSTSLLSYSNHYGDTQDYSSFGLEAQALFCPFPNHIPFLWLGFSLEGAFITFYQYSESSVPVQIGNDVQDGTLFRYHRETFLNPYGGLVVKTKLIDNKKYDLALTFHPKFHLVGERFLQCGLADLEVLWGVKF